MSLEVTMKNIVTLLTLTAACSVGTAIAQNNNFNQGNIERVLLISIDGMHAVDYANCANGIGTANNGVPYCPALAALGKTGVTRRHLMSAINAVLGSYPSLITDAYRAVPPGEHARFWHSAAGCTIRSSTQRHRTPASKIRRRRMSSSSSLHIAATGPKHPVHKHVKGIFKVPLGNMPAFLEDLDTLVARHVRP